MTDIDLTPLIVLSNRGATYIGDCLQSLEQHSPDNWAPDIHIVDDSGDPVWRAKLIARFGHQCTVHAVDDHAAGYNAAMQRVWAIGRELATRAFFLEEDFVFIDDFDIVDLQDVLDANDNLVQAALLREPWYPNEKRRGVMEAQRARVDAAWSRSTDGHPKHTVWAWHDHPVGYHSHDAGFTGNPSLLSAHIFDHDWPAEDWSEEKMGNELIARGHRFAWVPKAGTKRIPVTRHIGAERAPTSRGY